MITETDQNKALVAEFLAVFSGGDVKGVLSRMHEGGTWWVSGSIPNISGTYDKTRFGELLEGVTKAYKGGALSIKPLKMIAEKNYVAVEAESYAELLNGRVYNNLYHLLFEISGKKVLRVKEYMDTKHAFDTFAAP